MRAPFLGRSKRLVSKILRTTGISNEQHFIHSDLSVLWRRRTSNWVFVLDQNYATVCTKPSDAAGGVEQHGRISAEIA